jgi:hypothetical protein
MWWSSLNGSSVTASATHALGLRQLPGGGPLELPSISLTGVPEWERSMSGLSGAGRGSVPAGLQR